MSLDWSKIDLDPRPVILQLQARRAQQGARALVRQLQDEERGGEGGAGQAEEGADERSLLMEVLCAMLCANGTFGSAEEAQNALQQIVDGTAAPGKKHWTQDHNTAAGKTDNETTAAGHKKDSIAVPGQTGKGAELALGPAGGMIAAEVFCAVEAAAQAVLDTEALRRVLQLTVASRVTERRVREDGDTEGESGAGNDQGAVAGEVLAGLGALDPLVEAPQAGEGTLGDAFWRQLGEALMDGRHTQASQSTRPVAAPWLPCGCPLAAPWPAPGL